MMRSMFSGISGLRNHQMRMDVIGNNIANVNTLAFKASRVTFQEVFSQTLRGASAPTDQRGGSDPIQIGLGMAVGSVDLISTPGNIQTTGLVTDLAIQGEGYFIVSDGGVRYYTRAGDFKRDANGSLVTSTGLKVQGWAASAGVFGPRTSDTLTELRIPIGQSIPAQASTVAHIGRNLDSNTAIGGTVVMPLEVYDSLGNMHSVTLTWTKTALNSWSWDATGANVVAGSAGTATFRPNGSLLESTGGPIRVDAPGATQVAVSLNLDSLTQSASESGVSTVEVTAVNGYRAGVLNGFTIDATGIIRGSYSNGINQPIGQVATAYFANPGALAKRGEGIYAASANTGQPQVGEPGTSGRGLVAPSSLEMSNIDLASEFTNLIITQRGFQANSRIITTSDEMLQELAALKR